MTTEMFTSAAQRYLDALQSLSPREQDAFFLLVDEDVEFLDPFNHTRGKLAMRSIFSEMFEKLPDVSFDIHHHMTDVENQLVFAHWTFSADNKWTGRINFQGMSRLHLNDQAKVDAHFDYWDAASEIYEKLPVLAGLFRMLKAPLRVREGQI